MPLDRSLGAAKTAQRQALLERLRATGRPFDYGSIPTLALSDAISRKMHQTGIRELPYPFDNSFGVTSDTDLSARKSFKAYVGELVNDHGLDFGDSVWLHSNTGPAPGAAYLSRDFSKYDVGEDILAVDQMDLFELLQETADGNIDHWHSFLVQGPRIVRCTTFREHDEPVLPIDARQPLIPEATRRSIVVELPSQRPAPHSLHNITQFPIYAVSVFVKRVSAVDVAGVTIEGLPLGGHKDPHPSMRMVANSPPRGRWLLEEEKDTSLYPNLAKDDGEERLLFFVVRPDCEKPIGLPRVHQLHSIHLHLAAGSTADLIRVYLHNCHSEVLLGALQFLYRIGRVGLSLNTTHALWHFTGWRPQLAFDAINSERWVQNPDALESYFGDFDIPGHHFSTVADRTNSFARVFPDLVRDFGLSFFRVTGTDYPGVKAMPAHDMEPYQPFQDEHSTLARLAYPIANRMGGGAYYVRTTMGSLPAKYADIQGVLRDKGTQRSFTMRLEQTYAQLTRRPKQAALLYTHLGNLEPDNEILTPYFDQQPLHAAQRSMYGIPDAEGRKPESRVWFSKASVLCTYAVFATELADVIERQDSDVIKIHRWDDPIFETVVPEHPEQLYGQTFHVADAARARIFLGDEEIRDIVRNVSPSGEPPSVTIGACGTLFPVFVHVDPFEIGGKAEAVGGSWQWNPAGGAGGAYGSGRISLNGGIASVSLHRNELKPFGAQVLAFDLRRERDAEGFVLSLETATGGKFAFGDAKGLEHYAAEPGAPPLASYTWRRGPEDAEGWTRILIPLYDLTWRSAGPDGCSALPNHEIVQLRFDFLGSGDSEESIEIARVCFGRPRTGLTRFEPKKIVLGGRATVGAAVRIVSLAPRATATQEYLADYRGGFLSDPIARGSYRVTNLQNGASRVVDAERDYFNIDVSAAGSRTAE